MSIWSIIAWGILGGAFIGIVASLLMKREFWPWFGAGFLAWPLAAIVLIVSALIKPREGAKTYAGIAAIVGVVFLGVGAGYYLSLPDFHEDDIASVKEQIRSEYLKEKGVTKVDVTMVKLEAKKLGGFAIVEKLGQKLTVSCEANLDANGQNFIWRCQ